MVWPSWPTRLSAHGCYRTGSDHSTGVAHDFEDGVVELYRTDAADSGNGSGRHPGGADASAPTVDLPRRRDVVQEELSRS